MTSKELSDLSDSDLVLRLTEKKPTKSWTMGELYEIERRGFQLLDSDPELRNQLLEIRDKHHSTVSEMIKPWVDRQFSIPNIMSLAAIERLEEIFKGQKKIVDQATRPLGIAFPRLEFPTGSLQGLTGPLPESVSKLEVENPETDKPLGKVALDNLATELKITNKLLSRDCVFWVIAVSTCLSAVATIWMLVLTIQNQK